MDFQLLPQTVIWGPSATLFESCWYLRYGLEAVPVDPLKGMCLVIDYWTGVA